MTTKTKTTPSGELAKLVEKRTNAHAKVRAVRADRDAFDAETEAMRAAYTAHRHDHPDQYEGVDFRPRAGTEAAKFRDRIRSRMAESNPHEAEYAEARAAFHVAGEAEETFRRSKLQALIDEHDAAVAEAEDAIRAGLRSLIEGSELYNRIVEDVRHLVIDCPGLTGQDLSHDSRPDEWIKFASAALDGEIRRPGISDLAAWKLEQ